LCTARSAATALRIRAAQSPSWRLGGRAGTSRNSQDGCGRPLSLAAPAVSPQLWTRLRSQPTALADLSIAAYYSGDIDAAWPLGQQAQIPDLPGWLARNDARVPPRRSAIIERQVVASGRALDASDRRISLARIGESSGGRSTVCDETL